MKAPRPQTKWGDFLKYYSDANRNRKTRLGVFEKTADVTNDYWLENGLPLMGIDLEVENGSPVIEVMLGGYTHVVRGVRALRPVYSFDGAEDGIDLIGPGETTTILRFEADN
jgi:hypothetical protein